MKTIVGLFENNESVLNSIHELHQAGIADDNIRVLVCNDSGRARIGQILARLVARYTGRGILVGMGIAGLFGLIIGLGGLTVYGFGLRFLVIALIAFTGIGLALGFMLGALFGIDNLERVAHLCTEGKQFGGTLELIQTSNELAPRAINILQRARAVAIEIYPESDDDRFETLAENGSVIA
jgi:hypothetical protein